MSDDKRLIETAVVEGNTAELPLFVLSNREAMPLRPVHTTCPRCGTKLRSVDPELSSSEIAALAPPPLTPRDVEAALDAKTLRGRLPKHVQAWVAKLRKDTTPGPPLLYYGCTSCAYRIRLTAHPEDYKQVHSLPNGHRVIVGASVHHGFPTMLAHRVLLSVFDKCRELGYPDAKVPITYSEIAERIDVPLSGRYQQLITQALHAMNTLSLSSDHWWDREGQRHVTITGEEKLIASFRLSHSMGSPSQMTLPYVGNFVQLGAPLFQSLKAKYRAGIDLAYLNRLSTTTAQRLYVYLTKHDGRARQTDDTNAVRKPDYSEDLLSLAAKLPLRVRYRSDALRILKPALVELATPQRHPDPAHDGKRFLLSWASDGRTLSVYYAGLSLRAMVHARAAGAQRTLPGI